MPKPKGVSRLDLCARPRRNVAVALDWQGVDDGEIAVVTAGADMEWLVEIFTSLCGSSAGLARGFRIESQQPPKWRNGFINERLAVVLEDSRKDVLLPESLLMIVKGRLERYVNGGNVDCYDLDDLLNLSKREPEKIFTPKPLPSAVLPEKKKRGGRRNTATHPTESGEGQKLCGKEEPTGGEASPKTKEPSPGTNEATPQNDNKQNEEDMAYIALRVPWYVAAYYRGREEDNQLTEWDPVEFSDYTHEYMILENNLRYLPEQIQSRNCFSQRAWQNILHGRNPDGSRVIIQRNVKEWPTIQEVSTLIGAACHGKQAGSEYLLIRTPREVYYNKHVYRTTPGYCLSYDVGIYLASMITRKFCYEYLEWTEYRKEFARKQGVKAKTIDIVEMFFTQFNFPVAILPTERESLRRMHTRWLSNAKKRPAYHYNFDDKEFLEHISDEDRKKADDRAKRYKY